MNARGYPTFYDRTTVDIRLCFTEQEIALIKQIAASDGTHWCQWIADHAAIGVDASMVGLDGGSENHEHPDQARD